MICSRGNGIFFRRGFQIALGIAVVGCLFVFLFVKYFDASESTLPPISPVCPPCPPPTPSKGGTYSRYDDGLRAIDELRAQVPEIDVYGNIAWHPNQLFYYFRKIMDPNVKMICEIGFGEGHFTTFAMTVRPDIIFHSFDIRGPPSQTWVKNRFGSRFILHSGDSRQTVPAFDIPQKCDFVHVDGEHSPEAVYLDGRNMLPKSAKGATVLFDDMNMPGLLQSFERLVAEGVMERTICLTSDPDGVYETKEGKLFCAGKYRS